MRNTSRNTTAHTKVGSGSHCAGFAGQALYYLGCGLSMQLRLHLLQRLCRVGKVCLELGCSAPLCAGEDRGCKAMLKYNLHLQHTYACNATVSWGYEASGPLPSMGSPSVTSLCRCSRALQSSLKRCSKTWRATW